MSLVVLAVDDEPPALDELAYLLDADDRVAHVHFKDVDASKAKNVQDGRWTYTEGVSRGILELARMGRISATSAVRLPWRRSFHTGLPVALGSPNTPRRSSRSWNATPSGRP